MGLRDRFFTPQTAKAILSWRILIGVGVAAAMAVAGVSIPLAIGVGIGIYIATVTAAIPRPPQRPAMDPFALSEPWRQLIQRAQAARRKLADVVDGVGAGPLRTQLDGIVAQLDHGLNEAWEIAKRGDEIDELVRRLDPTNLRSELNTLRQRDAANPSPDTTAAADAVQRQLDSAERLKQQSDAAAATLRLVQTQLDSLVAGASEVRVGTADSTAYSKQVDDLVLQLEALRQAVQETPQ